MKQLIIRECAFRACEKAINGKQILFEIIREAFNGNRIEWDEPHLNDELGIYTGSDVAALHEAIAPDVFASVLEEATPDQMADDICRALGAAGLFDDSPEGE